MGVGALKDDSLRGGNDRASMPRRACLGARLRQADANLPRGCLVSACRNATYRHGRWADSARAITFRQTQDLRPYGRKYCEWELRQPQRPEEHRVGKEGVS